LSRAPTQPAYVLHQWDWSETSLVLDLFTRDLGRIAVVAKGAKRPYSQLRSVLLPFQRIAVSLTRSRPPSSGDDASEIHTLRSAEFIGPLAALPPERLFSGFYLNELLMKLLARHDPHEQLFAAYGQALATLAWADEQAALRAFELELMREVGVLPELGRTTTTLRALEPAAHYRLSGEAGLNEAPQADLHSALAGEHWMALAQALQMQDHPALCTAALAAGPALRTQLRALLHYHLGTTRLRSRDAMRDARALLDAAASVDRSSVSVSGNPS
jgi:DNA repair protein RecO (recombination protein O)